MNREFRGVWIPKEILLNKDLTPLEKLYLTEIDSLNNDEKGCYASNKHFEKKFGQTKSNVSRTIKNLEQKGWINISYIYNGKEVESRIIKISRSMYPSEYYENDNRYYQNDEKVLSNLVERYYQNDKENNTILNKQLDNILSCEDTNLKWNEGGKNSTKDKDKDKTKDIPLSCEVSNVEENNDKVKTETYKEIIDYMNTVYQHNKFIKKVPFSYRYNSKNTKGLINARIREGYTINDFKDVIWWGYRKFVEYEFKTQNEESSVKYFRPSTLFNEKHFEDYLNEYRANTE